MYYTCHSWLVMSDLEKALLKVAAASILLQTKQKVTMDDVMYHIFTKMLL